MFAVLVFLWSLASAVGQPRPLAPSKPENVACTSSSVSSGSLQVSCTADFQTTDEVDFGIALSDDPKEWAYIHYVANVAEDGRASAIIHGLTAGLQYKVSARAHHKGSSEGWNEKWSAVTTESVTCHASTLRPFNESSYSVAKSVRDAASLKTTWMEVFRYRGPGYHSTPTITDYNLPDFLDNHNTGDANKQLGRWDFAGSGSVDYNVVSYTRYCVEVLDVQLATSVHAIGTGGPTKTSAFSSYLPCDAGKCHCANKFDAFALESELGTPRSFVDGNCPSGQGHCACDETQLGLSSNYTGRWTFRPPFSDDAWMDGSGNPRCGWSEHQYPCHADATPHGYFYHHPEHARCTPGASVGDNGCTWRRSPLMHTLSVQKLLDAGVWGGQSKYRETETSEELHSAELGKKAFEDAGAMPCGAMPPPSPAPVPPSPTPPSPSGCPGGSLTACMQLCPSDPAAFQTCVKECQLQCKGPSVRIFANVVI